MTRDPVSVSPDTSVADLVDGYIYKHHFKMYPVVDHGSLLGVVTTRQVKEMPREEWDRHVVKEITAACQDDNTIPPEGRCHAGPVEDEQKRQQLPSRN